MASVQSPQDRHDTNQSLYNPSPASRRISEGADKAEDDESSDESAADDGQRKRKRTSRPISISCELCKQRKVKCDRGRPSCGWCLRNGQMCEYKERKKPGLRAGYGRELESRLEKLENTVQSQQLLLQQIGKVLPLDGRSPQLQQPSQHILPPIAQIQDNVYGQQVNHQQSPYQTEHHGTNPASYTQADMSPPHPPLERTTSMVSSSQYAAPSYAYGPSNGFESSLPARRYSNFGIPIKPMSSASAVAIDQHSDLPPYDLLYTLVDLYFIHIHPWCPFLHRRTTLDSLFGPSNLDSADRILLHAIVATTLRFSTDPRLTEHAREKYHSRSKQKVLLYGLENSSVRSLQALVILALDILGSSNGPPGWNILALITRSVVQLGLAVETTSTTVNPLIPSIYTLRAMVLPEPKDFVEDESRRRLFWTIYLLDRYATISTAFDFALHNKDIDRKLPCKDDLFSRNQYVDTRWFSVNGEMESTGKKSEHLGAFSYYIEILGILSRVHRFLKKPVDISTLPDVEQWQREYRELDRVLNNFKFYLPDEYSDPTRVQGYNTTKDKLNSMSIYLHTTYHTVVMRLHSSAAYPTTRSAIFTPSYSASTRCLSAASEISTLCSHIRAQNLTPYLGPPFAFSVWVAARLLLVHSSTISHTVDPAIHILVATLRDLGVHWPVASRYATLLQRVLDEFRESESQQLDSEKRVTPSTVKILADMRRTAFDLEFLISRQPKLPLSAAKSRDTVNAARAPAESELEYLDVFDFFNLPRLPLVSETTGEGVGINGDNNAGDGGLASEFNITNFMIDADADWFMQAS